MARKFRAASATCKAVSPRSAIRSRNCRSASAGSVHLQIVRNNLQGNTPDDQLEYLVVTEPLPSGTSVIESSVTGGFERFEVGPGSITFYIGNRRGIQEIRFRSRRLSAGPLPRRADDDSRCLSSPSVWR